MKEDVEDLPKKEEVVVRVQLTKQQRRFYNGIYEKQARLAVCCFSMGYQAMFSWAGQGRILFLQAWLIPMLDAVSLFDVQYVTRM